MRNSGCYDAAAPCRHLLVMLHSLAVVVVAVDVGVAAVVLCHIEM